MSYRDDEQAAHHRRDALEREVVALERRQREALAPKKRVDWSSVVPTSIGGVLTGSFTVLAIVLGWGTGWAIAGFIATSIVVLGLMGSSGTGLPTGAVAVRLDVDAPCADGRAAVRVLATVRLMTTGDGAKRATESFAERTRQDVADGAGAILEGVVRERLRAATAAELVGLQLSQQVAEHASTTLGRAGLELVSLWAGPA